MDKKDKISLAIGFCLFMAVGIWAIVDPGAVDGWIATGRKAWAKALVKAVWGVPFGITMIIFSILALLGLFCTKYGEEEYRK